MEIEPSVSLIVNGVQITTRLLDVLKAVYEEGSQKRASERLEISVPVLHRYLRRMEKRVGVDLLVTSSSGTTLTSEAESIVLEYSALSARIRTGKTLVVGGTIVTEELLLCALSKVDKTGMYDLIISDDDRNLRDFRSGLMDLVVVDDPLHVFDLEGVMWDEVAEDNLVHMARGPNYMRFRYGAQRLGFKYLDDQGIRYKVKGTVPFLPDLMGSNLSFFINQSLLTRKGIKLKGATDMKMLAHKIFAVHKKQTPKILALIAELKKERIHRRFT